MITETQRWEDLESLGRGGQAEGFWVRDRTGLHAVDAALKRMTDASRLNRIDREVSTMTQLARAISGIPPVLDVGILQGKKRLPFYAMPLFEANLTGYISRNASLDTVAWIQLLIDVAHTLNSVHHVGVAHRDLKPENILVDEAGIPAVADFGLCLSIAEAGEEDRRFTEDWRAIGSRLYQAPELEIGMHPDQDHRTADFWSFAKIIWTTITGKVYFSPQIN